MSDEQATPLDEDAAGPIVDPLWTAPPRGIMQRPAIIRPNKLNTLRLMHDPKDTDRARWFDTSFGMPQVREGNEVMYLVRGDETFTEMVAAIKSAMAMPPDHTIYPTPFIYLLAWTLHDHFDMLPGVQMKNLLKEASSKGVEIRAMFWGNRWFADAINALPTGRGVGDSKTALLEGIMNPIPAPGPPSRGGIPLPLPYPTTLAPVYIRAGAHHQKVLIVNGVGGLKAFCGGIDINADRVDQPKDNFSAFQDVHCRIRGPAAHDLLRLFKQRWTDYLYGTDPDPDHDPSKPDDLHLLSKNALSNTPMNSEEKFGRQFVQIGRTHPHRLYNWTENGRSAFGGDQTARKIILHAIRAAKTSIYIEDQYVLNIETAAALAEAIAKPTFKYLIIVMPDDGIDKEFFGLASYHRIEFFKRLKSGPGAEKVQVFCARRYVHSKMYIVDDKLAIIGSANCNRRGYEHDSEVVAAIFDEASDEEPAYHFAHRLRIKLWADHLNLSDQHTMDEQRHPKVTLPCRPSNTDDEFSELADGVASAAHWLKLLPNARVSPYLPKDHQGMSADETFRRALEDAKKEAEEQARQQDEEAAAKGEGSRLGRGWRRATHGALGTAEDAAMYFYNVLLLNHLSPLTAQQAWDLVFDPPSPESP